MKYEDVAKFMSPQGGALVHKLSNLQVPFKTAYHIGKLNRLVFKSFAKVKDDYQKEIVDKFVAKNEDGTPKEALPGTEWWEKGKEKELHESEAFFNGKIIDIDWTKLKLSELEACKFSSQELEILEPLIEFPKDDGTPLRLV